jgi:hypothetical protein
VLVGLRWKVPLWELDRLREKDISFFLILIWIKSLQLESALVGLRKLNDFNEFTIEFAISAVLVEATILVDAA